MPCYSPDPTERELKTLSLSKKIVCVHSKLGTQVPDDILEISKMPHPAYPNQVPDKLDRMTSYLCGILRGLDKKTFEEIVYNARCKESRRLADWWEEHEKFDRNRNEKLTTP